MPRISSDQLALAVILIICMLIYAVQSQHVTYRECARRLPPRKRAMLELNILLHIFCHTYSLYGFLFESTALLLIYLAAMPIIAIGWYIHINNSYFKSPCTMNMMTDYICGVEPQRTIVFSELFGYFGVPVLQIPGAGKVSVGYIVLLCFGWTVALYKLTTRWRRTP